MSRMEYVSQIVGELGRGMGMHDLSLDEEGKVSLLFDDVRVTFMYSDNPVDLLWLFVDLADVDPEQQAPLEALLQLGFLTWSRGRMTIGMSGDGRKAIGHTVIPVVNLDIGVVQDTLGQFLESAMSIRERMARGDYELDNGPSGGGDRPESGIRA